MSNKKILSVKPTKNPKKFIFETEMLADELKEFLQAKFPSTYECIESIKPSGLWKNKLFVTFTGYYNRDHKPDMLVKAINEKLDAEEAEAKKTVQEAVDWVVEYMGSINTTMRVKESTARYFACACAQHQNAYYDGVCIETKNIKLIKNTKTGKQLWPRENTCLWRICYKSTCTNDSSTVENTPEYAKDLIERSKEFGCGAISVSSFDGVCNDTAYVLSIKVFDEKWKLIWPKEIERLWWVKTKDKTYDVPEKVASAYLKHLRLFELHGIGFDVQDWKLVDLIDKSNLCNVPYNSVISITDPDGKVVWQKKQYCTIEIAHHTGVIHVSHETADTVILQIEEYRRCVEERTPTAGCIHVRSTLDDHVIHFNDIKHIYDENGHDMLADGLAKTQEPKDIWHVEVRKQATIGDNKFDLRPRIGLSLLDQLQSGIDVVTFHDVNDKSHLFKTSNILCLWNNEKTLWSHEDKKPDNSSFSAPSLLSRIYE